MPLAPASRMSKHNRVEGEGSYSGTKDYNQRTEKFVKSGKVDKAAPKSKEEAQAMRKAERIGRSRAKK